MYDLIVLGGGPAGVSAVLYGVARGMKVLLLEKNKIGGLIAEVSVVSHYSGLVENETGSSFSKRLEKQLENCRCAIAFEEAIEIKKNNDIFEIKTNVNNYLSKSVVYACGSSYKPLLAENIDSFEVFHSTVPFLSDKEKNHLFGMEVFVAGGSDGAAKEALTLANLVGKTGKVYMVQDQEELLCIAEFKNKIKLSTNIEVLTGSKIVKIDGNVKTNSINTVEVQQDNGKLIEFKTTKAYKVFAFVGQTPNTKLVDALLTIDNGYISTKDVVATDVSGLFVAGDCRVKDVRQIATAVNDGAIAAIKAFQYIKTLSN